MGKAAQHLEKVEILLEKYKKNKELVPEKDLQGKYKVPFEKLKRQIADELESYLIEYCVAGLPIKNDDRELIEKINQIFVQECAGKRIGTAVFRDFDLETVKKIAKEIQEKIYRVWSYYFSRHTCLYITEPCLKVENPESPLIYNDLVDKFWNEDTKEWIDRDKPPGKAVLMFISEKE